MPANPDVAHYDPTLGRWVPGNHYTQAQANQPPSPYEQRMIDRKNQLAQMKQKLLAAHPGMSGGYPPLFGPQNRGNLSDYIRAQMYAAQQAHTQFNNSIQPLNRSSALAQFLLQRNPRFANKLIGPNG